MVDTTFVSVKKRPVGRLCIIVLLLSRSGQGQPSEFRTSLDDDLDTIDGEFVFPHHVPRLKKQITTPSRVAVPLPLDPPSNSLFIPEPSGCDQDFCENDERYPDPVLLKQLIKSKTSESVAKLFFSPPKDPIRQAEQTPLVLSHNVDARLPDDRDIESNSTFDSPRPTPLGRDQFDAPTFAIETPVCDSIESYIYPRSARNIDRKWRFVVNLPSGDYGNSDNYVQAVKIERCRRSGEPCNIYSASGSETVCRQKYSTKQLMAISETGEQYVDSFRFPSCCVCYEVDSYQFNFALYRENGTTSVLLDDEPRNGTHSNTQSDNTQGSSRSADTNATDGGDDVNEHWKRLHLAMDRRKGRRRSSSSKSRSSRRRTSSYSSGAINFPRD